MPNTITLPPSVVEQALHAIKYSSACVSKQLTTQTKHAYALGLLAEANETLRAALEQPQVNSPEIPEGWKLVPVEPTDEMREAGKDAHYEAETRTSDADAWSLTGFAHRVVRASYIYRAMLAAAPQPPVVEQPQGEQEPVAWCALNADRSGIAYFDGKPIIMTGPIGNEHHPDPLYTHPQPKRGPLTDEQIFNAIRPLCNNDTNCHAIVGLSIDEYRAIERAHGIGGEA